MTSKISNVDIYLLDIYCLKYQGNLSITVGGVDYAKSVCRTNTEYFEFELSESVGFRTCKF